MNNQKTANSDDYINKKIKYRQLKINKYIWKLHKFTYLCDSCLNIKVYFVKMNTTIDYEAIKDRPVYTLSCAEFCALTQYAHMGLADSDAAPIAHAQAIGISALASALSCSPSQIAIMRRDGALRDCVISHVGRKYVFDVEKARKAANNWKAAKNQEED